MYDYSIVPFSVALAGACSDPSSTAPRAILLLPIPLPALVIICFLRRLIFPFLILIAVQKFIYRTFGNGVFFLAFVFVPISIHHTRMLIIPNTHMVPRDMRSARLQNAPL